MEQDANRSYPTGLFTILQPRDQEIGNIYVFQERLATDFDARKLWKGRSGTQFFIESANSPPESK